MFKISTTTTPNLITTMRWYGRDPIDYYYYEGGPDPGWASQPENFFTPRIQEKILENSEVVDHIFSYFGLILNILHFFILIRKELRTNVVFLIMIGICLCDLMVFSASIAEKKLHSEVGDSETCNTKFHWWMLFAEVFSKGAQKLGRLSAAFLALSMAGIRAITVMFPMSTVSEKIMKEKFGAVMVLVEFLGCGIWYAVFYSNFSIEFFGSNAFGMGGCYWVKDWSGGLYEYLEGFIVCILTCLYVIATATLIITLKHVQKKRKNLRGQDDKHSNTSLLVTIMAISFFIAELVYSLIFLFSSQAILRSSNAVSQLTTVFSYISKTILTVNSIFHCLLSFLLSSQYRGVVKKLLRLDKKSKENFARAASSSGRAATILTLPDSDH